MNNQQHADDFINLYELWQVIAKRKMLIIGIFLIAVLGSGLYSYLSPKVYSGYAIFEIVGTDVITPNEIVNLLGTIDSEKRAKILPETSAHVSGVKIEALRDSKNKVMVTVEARKNDKISLAISEVYDYLNKVDIVKAKVGREKEILLKKKSELAELIKASPDLLEMYYKMLKEGQLSTVGFNPIEAKKTIIATKIELLFVEQMLSKLDKGFLEYAVQPYISSRPVSPKTWRNMGITGILSLFLGICLAVFVEYAGRCKNAKGSKS